MKISMFHLMPYRDLPADFEKRYNSVWVDPPYWELADSEKIGQYYNWTLDELIHAADSGMDGICVNEHHQNAYGFMPNPDLMGSVLARATNGTDVAVVQMGSTLPTSNPPIRNFPDRTARAILRSSRPDSKGLDRARNFCVERQVLQVADGQHLAAPN